MRQASLAPGKGSWLLALLLAALLHLGVAALIFWVPAPPQGQAVAAGTGGVQISLGPAGGPQDRAGEETPTPEPQLEPKPAPKPEPKPEPKPDPKPEPESKPVTMADAKTETPPQTTPPPQAQTAGAAGRSGTENADQTGSGDQTAGGGLPGDTRDYMATLQAWLERHKEYPRRARYRRQEGTSLLYFSMDRSGRVLSYRIEESSGHRLLDEEVLAMIQRAQPLPPMPDSVQRDVLEMVIPVQFFLR